MFDFDIMVKSQRKWMLYLLVLFMLGAAVLPYERVFNGLALGGAISFYNLWLLQHKVKVFGETVARGDNPRGSLGTFSRMATAALGALIAMRYEESFHIIAVAVGIISSYFVLGIDGIIRLIKRESKTP